MAIEHLEVGSVAVGLIIDGDENTPWVAGALRFDENRGVAVEVPYLEHAALQFGEAEAKQFGHIDRWFSYDNAKPPTNLLMRLQAGDVSLFNCHMSAVTSNLGRGSAFGVIGAEHVVLAERAGPHDAPLMVNRLQSRLDGLREWTRFTSVEEEVSTDPETGLIQSVQLTIEAGDSLTWHQGDATVSIRSDWNLTGPQELRAVHDDLVLLSEFVEPRSIEDHLSIHRQVANLLIVLFGVPINFRRHKVSGDGFTQQYGERVHAPYRELITRSTRREHHEPQPPARPLREPLLWGALVGPSGMERMATHWDDWQRVLLPLVGRLRRRGATVEDRVVSASMTLEAAGRLVGSVPEEQQTYRDPKRVTPTTATFVFRVLADLGIILPQSAEATIGLARGIAKNYNAIKHYNGGRFPDDMHTYVIGEVAMFAARLYVAKLVLGRTQNEEDAEPIAAMGHVATKLAEIGNRFENEGLYLNRAGDFVERTLAK